VRNGPVLALLLGELLLDDEGLVGRLCTGENTKEKKQNQRPAYGGKIGNTGTKTMQ
jgi:hypothetical protein